MKIQTLDSLTNLVYQAALDGEWRPFINQFMQATGSNNGWLMMSDSQSLTPYFSDFISTYDNVDHDYFLSEYIPRITEDPFYRHSIGLTESACFLGSDIVAPNQLSSYSLYPLFEQVGCEHMLAAIPVRDKKLNSFTVMNRHKKLENYTRDDVRLMEMMVPHINRAFHLYSVLLRQQQQISLYQAILEQNPNPLVLVDEKLKVNLCNEAAHQLLNQQNLIVERNGRLVGKSLADTQSIQGFVRLTLEWLQAKTPDPISITLGDGREKIHLKAYPVHPESDFNNYTDKLCIIEIFVPRQPNWTLVADDFGLTPKELRTIKYLYEGMTLKNIAEHTHLSFNTIKSQLMSVYSKSHLNSQGELIAKLASYIQ